MRRPKKPWIVAAAFALLFGLALWPPSRVANPEDSAAAAAYDRKLGHLRDALRQGRSAEQTLSQDEINGRLHRVLAGNRGAQQSRGLTVGLHQLSAEARDGHLAVFVDARLLAIPVVFEARMGISPGGEHPLVLRSLRLGHLPLLGPFRQLVGGRMRAMFRQVEPERSLIPRLASATYLEGEVRVVVEPRIDPGEILHVEAGGDNVAPPQDVPSDQSF